MLGTIKKYHPQTLPIIIFSLLSTWWVFLQFSAKDGDFQNQLFGGIYGIMALLGAIWALKIANSWGGFKSIMGRSISMFAFGLLAQEFGQLSYWYYIFFKNVDVPYPSIGDIGYFGSIPFYIYGVWLLAQASGVKFSLQSLGSKIQAVIIPLVMVTLSYAIFLKGYEFDWSQPLIIFLDFGYPFGEAIYLSGALLAYFLSRNVLGGIMKYRILIILLALLTQYIADFTFLYQAQKETWFAGGVNDYMYLISYFVMTLGLLNLDTGEIKKGLNV